MSKADEYREGQRVIYIKRGEQPFYDTQWPATYLRRCPAGRHAIRIDGRKRISLVTSANLVPEPERRRMHSCDDPLCAVCGNPWAPPSTSPE